MQPQVPPASDPVARMLAQFPHLRRGNDASPPPPVYLESFFLDDFFPDQRDYFDRVHQYDGEFIPPDVTHVAAHIRDVSEFLKFLEKYNDEEQVPVPTVEDRRIFRTLIFEETTIDFTTLSRAVTSVSDIQTIIFDRVNIRMSDWNICSEQVNVFGRSRMLRFHQCRFLEDASFVSCPREDFRVPLWPEQERIRTMKTPRRFYHLAMMSGDLIYVDVHTGTILLSSSRNVSESHVHCHVLLRQECMPPILPLGS